VIWGILHLYRKPILKGRRRGFRITSARAGVQTSEAISN